MSIFKSNNAPYQKHSETSKEAAESVNAEKQRANILSIIIKNGDIGAIGDELAAYLKEIPGTVSARLIELERAGSIVRTNRKRTTRRNRNAFVYVSSKLIGDNNVKAGDIVSKASEKQIIKMLFELMKVSNDGSGSIKLTPFDVALIEDIAKRLKLKKVKNEKIRIKKNTNRKIKMFC